MSRSSTSAGRSRDSSTLVAARDQVDRRECRHRHQRAADRHLPHGDDGTVSYDRFDFDRQAIESESEAFFLRITGPGDYRYEGADLGILITRGRVMGDDFELNDRARNWIRGIKNFMPASRSSRRSRTRAGAGVVQDPLVKRKNGKPLYVAAPLF